ncbi:MAG: DUF1427 family protein [Proteobacteria bacterium]|nr:DUF1427 family protein [Pseudomonadota bacterium]
MKPYLISLAIGLAVGVLYAALKVRSPAPPAIALIGLLGMLIGEQLLPLTLRYILPPASADEANSSASQSQE